MKDMKNRVWRAISAVAMREHWRVRRVLLLVMVAVTALSMVTVKSMGDTVQPRRVYVVLTEDGRTEIISGRPTAVGNIAVDTSVFPYGTRMYVQTVKGSWHYGMATAADCGTAIKGNKIDLWFKTFSEACDWGRRDCTVYVLD